MANKFLLKDIVDVLNSKIKLFFRGSYIGEFTKEELKKLEWINDRVVCIETDGEATLCLYLSGSKDICSLFSIKRRK